MMWPSQLNRNLSNYEEARKKVFRGFNKWLQRDSNPTAMVTYSQLLKLRTSAVSPQFTWGSCCMDSMALWCVWCTKNCWGSDIDCLAKYFIRSLYGLRILSYSDVYPFFKTDIDHINHWTKNQYHGVGVSSTFLAVMRWFINEFVAGIQSPPICPLDKANGLTRGGSRCYEKGRGRRGEGLPADMSSFRGSRHMLHQKIVKQIVK